MNGCIICLVVLLCITLSTVVACGTPSKEKRKTEKTPEPTAPQGVPLGGSGERDDDTLKNVPSLQRDRQKAALLPSSS